MERLRFHDSRNKRVLAKEKQHLLSRGIRCYRRWDAKGTENLTLKCRLTPFALPVFPTRDRTHIYTRAREARGDRPTPTHKDAGRRTHTRRATNTPSRDHQGAPVVILPLAPGQDYASRFRGRGFCCPERLTPQCGRLLLPIPPGAAAPRCQQEDSVPTTIANTDEPNIQYR